MLGDGTPSSSRTCRREQCGVWGLRCRLSSGAQTIVERLGLAVGPGSSSSPVRGPHREGRTQAHTTAGLVRGDLGSLANVQAALEISARYDRCVTSEGQGPVGPCPLQNRWPATSSALATPVQNTPKPLMASGRSRFHRLQRSVILPPDCLSGATIREFASRGAGGSAANVRWPARLRLASRLSTWSLRTILPAHTTCAIIVPTRRE